MNSDLLEKENKSEKFRLSEVMKRVSFIRVNTKMILKVDFSGLEHREQVAKVAGYFFSIVEKMPKLSVVGLIDLSGLVETEEITQELVNLTKTVAPYFRASALIATDKRSGLVAKAVSGLFGSEKLPIFKEEDTAREWVLAR